MGLSVLIVGAGRSSSALIDYLYTWSSSSGATVRVGDISFSANHPETGKVYFDIKDSESSRMVIQAADLVISLLPAHLHPSVARICLQEKKHLLTASYVSDEMKSFDLQAKASGLLFLNECGLDPGIDHMSAMRVIDRIHKEGGVITSFESFTGGLIAPETDPGNPWRYKFTWNPRNVVMAGQGVSRFLEQGRFKFIPYQQLFQRTISVELPGSGSFEGYANRDSLLYRDAYGLQQVTTLLRGTLRYKGFCASWDLLVQLGCTDDSYQVPHVDRLSHRDFMGLFVEYRAGKSIEEILADKFNVTVGGPELTRLRWSGLFDDESIGLSSGSPAQILEHILNKKWKLNPTDQDLVVMCHRFGYELNGPKMIQSYLVQKGENSDRTAMAKTVGLPLAIASRLLLEGKIKSRGVVIPTREEFYVPILNELEELGVVFHEQG